jgi:hypothetical protein
LLARGAESQVEYASGNCLGIGEHGFEFGDFLGGHLFEEDTEGVVANHFAVALVEPVGDVCFGDLDAVAEFDGVDDVGIVIDGAVEGAVGFGEVAQPEVFDSSLPVIFTLRQKSLSPSAGWSNLAQNCGREARALAMAAFISASSASTPTILSSEERLQEWMNRARVSKKTAVISFFIWFVPVLVRRRWCLVGGLSRGKSGEVGRL